MDVTSNHLDVALPDIDDQGDGEELGKRGEDFGHPVGKSECLWKVLTASIDMRILRQSPYTSCSAL